MKTASVSINESYYCTAVQVGEHNLLLTVHISLFYSFDVTLVILQTLSSKKGGIFTKVVNSAWAILNKLQKKAQEEF